jgi:hypothetical protein
MLTFSELGALFLAANPGLVPEIDIVNNKDLTPFPL